jgi:hypothetical protein
MLLLIVLADAGSVGDVLVAGVPASIVIVLLVEVCKRCGVHRKFAPVLSIGFGIGLMVVTQVVRAVPALRAWYEAAGAGLMLGLSACGLYSGGKAMIVKRVGRYRELGPGDVIDGDAVIVKGGG